MDFKGTLVFMDLESTGIPSQYRKERITEAAFVAVDSANLLDTPAGRLPRVMNKLCFCYYPMKAVSNMIQGLTGLHNNNLFYQKHLDTNSIETVYGFLEHLAPPVYLLAHNGLRFDFGLLQAELKAYDKSLPEHTLCVDTLEMFKALDGRILPPNDKETQVNMPCSCTTPNSIPNGYTIPIYKIQQNDKCVQVPSDRDLVSDNKSVQCTPPSSSAVTPDIPSKKRIVEAITPERPLPKLNGNAVKRALFVEVNATGESVTKKRNYNEMSLSSSHTLYPSEIEFDPKSDNQLESNVRSLDSYISRPLYVSAKDDDADEHYEYDEDNISIAASEDTVDFGVEENPCNDELWDDFDDNDLLAEVEKMEKEWRENQTVSDAELMAIDESVFISQKSEASSSLSQSQSLLNPIVASNSVPCRGDSNGKVNVPVVPPIDKGKYCSKSKFKSSTGAKAAMMTTPTESAIPPINTEAATSSSPKRTKYNLRDLYVDVVGHEPPSGHRAEQDCISLLRVIQHNKAEVLNYLANHSRLFKHIKPTYNGTPNKQVREGKFPFQ